MASMSRGLTIPCWRTYCMVLSNGFVAVIVSIRHYLITCNDELQQAMWWSCQRACHSEFITRQVMNSDSPDSVWKNLIALSAIVAVTDSGRGRWCLCSRTSFEHCRRTSEPRLRRLAQGRLLAYWAAPGGRKTGLAGQYAASF